MDKEAMAEAIYNKIYGDIDSKGFRAFTQTRILDWLKDGDLTGNETLAELVLEWNLYENAAPDLPGD